MALYVSTGARQSLLKGDSLRDMFNRGSAELKIYSGAAPATADAAATGTLLVTITDTSVATGSKQKVYFTPTVDAGAGYNTYFITINGITCSFYDSGGSTVAQVVTGLVNVLNVANGGAITTPAGTITIPQTSGNLTVVDSTTHVSVESTTLGESFDYSVSTTGTGSGTLTATVNTNDRGLRFEAAADVATGIIEKLASQTWSGVAGASGTSGYFRLSLYGDAQSLSTSAIRLQGTVNTSNADLNMSKVNVVAGETHTIDTFQITAPAS